MVEIETKPWGAPPPSRVSHYINRKPASNLLHAINLAATLGRPLNQFVTLNFGHTSCPEALASRQFERLRDNHFGPWLRRGGQGPGGPPTFVWVIENGGGCLAIHWLVHIPPGRLADFKKRLPKWLTTVAGAVRCASAVHVRHAPTPAGAGKYMVKGIDPAYAAFYRIRSVPQGAVTGKRSGFSRCLGPTVRRRLQDGGQLPKRSHFWRWPSASRVTPSPSS